MENYFELINPPFIIKTGRLVKKTETTEFSVVFLTNDVVFKKISSPGDKLYSCLWNDIFSPSIQSCFDRFFGNVGEHRNLCFLVAAADFHHLEIPFSETKSFVYIENHRIDFNLDSCYCC